MAVKRISGIVSLTEDFDRSTFDCGVPAMNEYLIRYARQNEERHLTRTRVAMDAETGCIAGYYTTGLAQADFEEIPARGMPNGYPFTVGLLAQLAVDKRFKGEGLGRLMVMDCLARFEKANELSAIPAVALDLREPELETFYTRFGFVPAGK